MFPFPGISLHLSYLTWFTFNNAVKNAKKPETQDRWIGRRLIIIIVIPWSRWSLYYKACRLRFCFSVAACFGGALEGRGRLSAPEFMPVCDQGTGHNLGPILLNGSQAFDLFSIGYRAARDVIGRADSGIQSQDLSQFGRRQAPPALQHSSKNRPQH